MKIATWNLERLKHLKKLDEITAILKNLNADILILTETDERVRLDNYPFQMATSKLSEYYSESERRVKIYSKYEILRQIETCDDATSCCVELKTGVGNLMVYGTIIGVFGNRRPDFKVDLLRQIDDFKKLSVSQNLCVAGDFNISFADNYYFTKFGREQLNAVFEECEMSNLTNDLTETIDHIAVSRAFLKNVKPVCQEWNFDKKYSDHKGVCVGLN